MTNGTWRPWDDPTDDDSDDVAASHISGVEHYESSLDVFDEYLPAPKEDDDYADVFAVPEDDDEDELLPPLYTVANPSGTVAVTVHLNGRFHAVELAPSVAGMSEAELADEIRVIAELARARARSELHAFIVEGVRALGYDAVAMRDGLVRELDMPTPEMAAADHASVFSIRYSGDHD